MLNYFKSENLKFKRTFSRKFIVVAPSFFLLFAYLIQSNLRTESHYYMEMVFNWWPLLFMIEGTAILCVLSNSKDKKTGGYSTFYIHDVNGSKFWLSKILTVALYLLISTFILVFIVFISSKFFNVGIAPLSEIFIASIVIWITSIAMIPVYLFLSFRFGTVIAILSGIIGIAASVIFAPKSIWFLVPWSWAIRLMCPIVGVQPNGVALKAGDALLNASVLPVGIIISLIFFITTCFLTCTWFSKRRIG